MALEVLQGLGSHVFVEPAKKIHEERDVSAFHGSKAYRDITIFMMQINRSMFPTVSSESQLGQKSIQTWELDSSIVTYSDTVQSLQQLLGRLDAMIEEAPPDTGPRRFGNASFRKWYSIMATRTPELLRACLPSKVLDAGRTSSDGVDACAELKDYLLGSFGSPQRLDYGTGHELSFVAFLACLWKLGCFKQTTKGVEERGIVLGLIEPYLQLIRRLILTYTLEPAGSHGVWGLDDHSFIPFILGSAQLAPPISDGDQMPTEGSLVNTPDPADVTNGNVVRRERKRNMYFSAVGFIYDVKKGPFWEHSPILFDISGIKAGWAKINKGMIKMYNAEVLSKFPVVQHFPFGSLLSWEQDPNAVLSASPLPTALPPRRVDLGDTLSNTASPRVPFGESTGHPRASSSRTPLTGATGTTAPWTKPSLGSIAPPTRQAASGDITSPRDRYRPTPPIQLPAREATATQAPWVSGDAPRRSTKEDLPTRAPWARPEGCDSTSK